MTGGDIMIKYNIMHWYDFQIFFNSLTDAEKIAWFKYVIINCPQEVKEKIILNYF